MKQSSKSSISAALEKILPHLRHPMKLKMLLCCTLGGAWYAAFFAPLSEDLIATKALIAKERKRVNAAREIDRAKAKLAPLEKSIPAGDAAEFMRHIVEHVRTTPLRLIDLRPEKPKDIGPFQSPGLRLSLEGKYNDIDDLLLWVEQDSRLLRVDSLTLNASTKRKSHLLASIIILGLNQKPTETAKTGPTEKTAAKASPSAPKISTKPSPANALPKTPAVTKTGAPVGKPLGEARKKVAEIRKQVNAAASAPDERKPAGGTLAEAQ
jgi:hypothetical protein